MNNTYDTNECGICLDNIINPHNTKANLPCGHSFHTCCLIQCVRHNVCPTCNTILYISPISIPTCPIQARYNQIPLPLIPLLQLPLPQLPLPLLQIPLPLPQLPVPQLPVPQLPVSQSQSQLPVPQLRLRLPIPAILDIYNHSRWYNFVAMANYIHITPHQLMVALNMYGMPNTITTIIGRDNDQILEFHEIITRDDLIITLRRINLLE